jgi:hypothetical protein
VSDIYSFLAAPPKASFRPTRPYILSGVPSPSPRSTGDAPGTPDTTRSEAESGGSDASLTHK